MIFYKKLQPIKAITFDLDDTLYENHSVIQLAEQALKQHMHSQFPESKAIEKSQWRALQQQQILKNPQLQHDMGQLRYETLQQGFHNLGYTKQQAKQATQQCFECFYFERSNFIVHEDIHYVLAALAARLPLVAITNGNVDIHQIGIAQYFSTLYKSSIDMPMKPNSAMFNRARQHLKCPAQNILHVGDNLVNDVYGAICAGYQSAWYADDRIMQLNREYTHIIPHVQLHNLSQLLELS